MPAAICDVCISSTMKKEDPQDDVEIPPPIPATREDVEMWMSSGFRKRTNMTTNMPPEIGESVLWRGMKTGPKGNPSTKCEWFNGKVHFVRVDDNETFVCIDSLAVTGARRVHQSDVECPTESSVVADGGRCSLEGGVQENFIENIRCPSCYHRARWFSSEAAYRQHWNSVHSNV